MLIDCEIITELKKLHCTALSLLGACFVFNIEYPKGCKNFLIHVLGSNIS